MRFPAITLVFAIAVTEVVASPALSKRAISQTTFDDLVRYMRYANGAYQASCPKPEGNTLVDQFTNSTTSTDGYIARDDTRKEIVAVFRGSQQLEDFLTDAEFALTPLVSPGITNRNGAEVHSGFLDAWNSVATHVLSVVQSQIQTYPSYTVISSGHSLGGAISSLAGLSFKTNFKDSTVIMYTFGQPRTGNAQYASLVDTTVGRDMAFRGTHTYDGVPTIPPTEFGYQHHGTEYWNYADPASTNDTKECSGDEDPTCSASIPSTGINPAHLYYFNQVLEVDASECTSA